jgi:hypothetical protein
MRVAGSGSLRADNSPFAFRGDLGSLGRFLDKAEGFQALQRDPVECEFLLVSLSESAEHEPFGRAEAHFGGFHRSIIAGVHRRGAA